MDFGVDTRKKLHNFFLRGYNLTTHANCWEKNMHLFSGQAILSKMLIVDPLENSVS